LRADLAAISKHFMASSWEEEEEEEGEGKQGKGE